MDNRKPKRAGTEWTTIGTAQEGMESRSSSDRSMECSIPDSLITIEPIFLDTKEFEARGSTFQTVLFKQYFSNSTFQTVKNFDNHGRLAYYNTD